MCFKECILAAPDPSKGGLQEEVAQQGAQLRPRGQVQLPLQGGAIHGCLGMEQRVLGVSPAFKPVSLERSIQLNNQGRQIRF